MFLFLTVWINFCSIFFTHPVYVSVTNMDIDARSGNIELSIRIFTDDLETVLHNKYNIDGWIGAPGEHRDARRLLGEYLNERLSVVVNNDERIDLPADSIVVADESVWFYLKGVAKQPIHRIEIDNRLLTDFFESQNNLVIISTGKEETGYRLDRRTYKIELSL